MRGVDDLAAMRRALRLASLGRHASPNPMVGCVILSQDGNIVGEGYHPMPGQPHAEVFALRDAGEAAYGATAYVTLEPCSHYGRTPPCADALIQAGVKRVVAAMADPDLRVSGQGIQKLRDAGIHVDVGLLSSQASELNAAYIRHRTKGLPWVTVKVAVTLDGKAASSTGDSKWITSDITRRWVHRQLRDRCDAIVVGVGTVLKDDPALTTRITGRTGRDPLRIIVDSRLTTPLESKVVRQSELDGKTVICCLAQFAQERESEFAERQVTVLPFAADRSGRVDLAALVHHLGTRGDVISVLVEGGPNLIASAIECDIVNRYISTIAPKLIGGAAAPGPIGGIGVGSTMDCAIPLRRWKVRRCAVDLVIDAHLMD